jgi:hypothetical protein
MPFILSFVHHLADSSTEWCKARHSDGRTWNPLAEVAGVAEKAVTVAAVAASAPPLFRRRPRRLSVVCKQQ